MTKLEELQKENRKFIIMANNPTAKTYNLALKMEVENLSFPDGFNFNSQTAEYILINDKVYSINWEQDNPYDHLIYVISVNEFEGYLTRLNRVLIALKGLACNLCLLDVDENYNIFIKLDDPFSDVGSFYWDLTKETLEEQSEETQKEINRIINSN